MITGITFSFLFDICFSTGQEKKKEKKRFCYVLLDLNPQETTNKYDNGTPKFLWYERCFCF